MPGPTFGDNLGITGVIAGSSGTFTITDIEQWSFGLGVAVQNRPGFADVWDSGTTYAVGDIVVGDGDPDSLRYRCIAASTNNQPPNATYWVRDDTTYPDLVTMGVEPSPGTCYGRLKHTGNIGLASLVASGAAGTMTKKLGNGYQQVAPVRVTGITEISDGQNFTVISFRWALAGPWREEAVT